MTIWLCNDSLSWMPNFHFLVEFFLAFFLSLYFRANAWFTCSHTTMMFSRHCSSSWRTCSCTSWPMDLELKLKLKLKLKLIPSKLRMHETRSPTRPSVSLLPDTCRSPIGPLAGPNHNPSFCWTRPPSLPRFVVPPIPSLRCSPNCAARVYALTRVASPTL